MAPPAALRRLLVRSALAACCAGAASAQSHPLVGVTGDGAGIPEALFLLSQANASGTLLMQLGNGMDGEAIAFNPDDDLLYHASGYEDGDRYWESIDVFAETIESSDQFTGPGVTEENVAMVHNAATGRFLVCDLGNAFFDATLAGAATVIGTVPDNLKGLAFAGGSLYGASNVSSALYRLNPASGAALSSVAVTLGGNAIAGMNGLATHPGTGALWGIFRVGNQPGTRHLGTVNPTTGVATSVGVLSQNYAGIAFLPEPRRNYGIAAGALAVLLCAELRRRRLQATA